MKKKVISIHTKLVNKFILRDKKILILFISIFICGLFLRFWELGSNPAGFFCDEASIGYNAYKIITSGKDEFGNILPIFFKSFGDFKSPLDIYFTSLPVLIMGLSEFSVRLGSAIPSILTLPIAYLLGREIKDKYLGLSMMLVLAVNPWHIHISRVNLEGMSILILILFLCLLFFLKFVKERKTKYFILFSLFSSLGIYAYSPSRIIFPIFYYFCCLFLLILDKKSLKDLLKGVLCFHILALPIIIHVFLGEGLSRWNQVSVFSGEINVFEKISKSYFLHFSPDYLFLKGDINMVGQFVTRHSIEGVGQFFFWEAVPLIVGLFYLFRNKYYFWIPILILLVLYPIPSSITQDIPPQATRSLSGIAPLSILIGLGTYVISKKLVNTVKYKELTQFLFLFCLCFVSSIYFFNMLKVYPNYSSDYWGWQYGPKEIMSYFKANKGKYDEMYMTGSFNAPEIFLKFYDAEKKCKNCYIGGVENFDQTKKQLFVIRPNENQELIDSNKLITKKLGVIKYPNNTDAFLIITLEEGVN